MKADMVRSSSAGCKCPLLLLLVSLIILWAPGADAQDVEIPPANGAERTQSEPREERSGEDEPEADPPTTPEAPPADDPQSEPQAEAQPESEPPSESEPQPGTEDESDAEQADAAELPDELEFTEFVVLPIVGAYGRAPIHIDPVDAAIARGEFDLPKAGDTITAADGRSVEWKSGPPLRDGKLPTRSITGGYAAAEVQSPASGVMLLRAAGHAAVYVNGEPHAGDPYVFGNFDLPVRVRKGSNWFLFHVAQGELTARLIRPAAPVSLSPARATLPTVVRGQEQKLWATVTVVNCADVALADAEIIATVEGAEESSTPLAWLDTAATRAAPVALTVPEGVDADVVELELRLMRDGETLDQLRFELEVVEADQPHIRTFRSKIDGSIQSYAVLPAADGSARMATQMVTDAPHDSAAESEQQPPGVILALHSAGMSAREFAAQYAPKPWAHVVAPTGRGLFPLDWEDWSRTDALEALEDFEKHFEVDAKRLYVSGHGMGAHGAVVLGVTAADRFAAIAATAAWPSLWTYGGGIPQYREPTTVQAMLMRAANPSNMLAMLRNLQQSGIYLLHGANDEDIPVEQSRLILEALAKWHGDFAYYEKPDAGNWWGEATVDSPEAMNFLKTRQRSGEPAERIAFVTSDLQASASSGWATIAMQEKQFAPSRIELERETSPHSIVGTTENVKLLSIDKSAVAEDKPFVVRLDGGRPVLFRGMPASGRVWVEKRDGRWRRSVRPDASDKGPQRYGGIKELFTRNVLLVYGTTGTEAENAWSRGKAHYDAETFAYRANGAIEVIPDTQFVASETQERNVVVYGNVDTNSAWPALLSTSPVQVRRGRISVDTRPEIGDRLGFMMVRPRNGSETALVGAIGGTGPAGMRLTNRLRYFWSGVAYPDLMILGPESLTAGDAAVRAAGYFSADWDVEDADIAWRDVAL